MIRELWDYDHHSHRVILNARLGRFSRRQRKEIGIVGNILNRPRIVVLVLIVTILFMLFLKEARSVLASSPKFIIQDIILENSFMINKNILNDILKIENNKGIFNISPNKIVRMLKKDPDIEDAVVEKVLPNKIRIKITERAPYVRLDINDKEYVIDRNGIVLLRRKPDKSVPLITGVKINRLTPGEKCMTPVLENIFNILRTGDNLGWGRFIEPQNIDVYSDNYISLYMKERILIRLKMDNIYERLNKLMYILTDSQRKGRLLKLVDLRFKDVYVE